MSRRNRKYDYDDDDYDDQDDYDDGYNAKQHPTSKHVKAVRGKAPVEPVVESVRIPPANHGLLIGKGGKQRRELEDEFDVVIDFPDRGSKEDDIYVEGMPDPVHKCIARMKEIVGMETVKASFKAGGGAKAATGKNEEAFPALSGQEIIVINVDVEKFAHGLVIGKHGSKLQDLKKRLSSKPGLPASNIHRGIDVIVPDRNDTSSIISVRVPAFLAESAEATIKEFFNFHEIPQHLRGISRGTSNVGASLSGNAATAGTKAAVNKKAQQPRADEAHSQATASSSTAPPSAAAAPSSVGKSQNVSVTSSQAGPWPASRPKAPTTTFVDLVATGGYTHAVKPQRR